MTEGNMGLTTIDRQQVYDRGGPPKASLVTQVNIGPLGPELTGYFGK